MLTDPHLSACPAQVAAALAMMVITCCDSWARFMLFVTELKTIKNGFANLSQSKYTSNFTHLFFWTLG